MFVSYRVGALAALVLPFPASAQDVPVVTTPPVPIATPTPAPTPPAPVLSLPPVVVPTPQVIPSPVPRPSPTLGPSPSPSPRPTPTPQATPTVAPTPTPTSAATLPAAVASPLPTGTDEREPGSSRWPWMLGAGVAALAGIGLWLARRRPAEAPSEEAVELPVTSVAPSPPLEHAGLTVAFRPLRAGFNMLSATVEGELTIANEGDGPAADIRVRTALMSAHVGQEAELVAFGREPAGRLAVPAFALASGERRVIRVVAATPYDGLRTMTAAGRPMFVPVLAVAVRTAVGEQAVQAFAIGIERVDSVKLAPFWLDVPPRSYDQVAARAHGATVRG